MLFVTLPPILRPLSPLEFVIFRVPSFVAVPSIVRPVPFSSLVIVMVPLFLSSPVFPTFNAPALFVMVKFPFGFETSPFIWIPSVPVFVIVVELLAPKFLIAPPASTFVPTFEVMTILPLALAKPLPVFMLSTFTSELKRVSAAF